MIQINNISKTFGSQVLFEDVSIKINPGEKVGLVGRNGEGKTTLLKIILQQEHYDTGSIDIPKNYTIGHVNQNIEFKHSTVLEEVSSALPEYEKDSVWKCEKVLSGLGFSEDDFQKDPKLFSGGFQVRINLAKILSAEPNMLLLDEPTNYLDIVSIRWLISFLKQWDGELILITHDRNFMDNVVTHTAVLHRRKMKKIPGDTSKAYNQIAKEEEIYENTRLNEEKKIKDMEEYISRFRAKASLAKMVQSRIKTLDKMSKKEKLSQIKDLEFAFNYKDFSAKVPLTVENLTFGYEDDNNLIEDFSITVGKNDRICIVGKNGKGKTTLLRLLAEELNPKEGVITYHPKVEKGYFAQTNVKTLEKNRTVLEEVESEIGYTNTQLARNICGSMMFNGDNALKKISVLSGGEKARVMLSKIIIKERNVLFLDEPTNHLDMQSADSLLEAIDCFEGAVIMVTHNEMFLNALAQRLIVFKEGRVYEYNGSYSDFISKEGWSEKENKGNVIGKKVYDKKEIRRMKAEIVQEKSLKLNPLIKEIEKNENIIIDLESKSKDIQEQLVEESSNQNSKKISELSIKHSNLEKEIEEKFLLLENLYEEKEKLEKYFKEKQEELD